MDRENTEQAIKEKVQLFVTGELDEKEYKTVFDWINSNAQNRRYYDELRAILRLTEFYKKSKNYNIQRAHARLRKRIEIAGEERKTDFKILFRIAASILLVVSISWH